LLYLATPATNPWWLGLAGFFSTSLFEFEAQTRRSLATAPLNERASEQASA
jgi:hypothetical protein